MIWRLLRNNALYPKKCGIDVVTRDIENLPRLYFYMPSVAFNLNTNAGTWPIDTKTIYG